MKLERLLSKSLTTLEVMTYYLVVHMGPGQHYQDNPEPLASIPACVSVNLSEACDTRPPRRPRDRQIRGSIPACALGIFPGSSQTSDLTIGTPVATLSGAWGYRVSAGTGWPAASVCCDLVRQKVYVELLSQCGSTSSCLS